MVASEMQAMCDSPAECLVHRCRWRRSLPVSPMQLPEGCRPELDSYIAQWAEPTGGQAPRRGGRGSGWTSSLESEQRYQAACFCVGHHLRMGFPLLSG